MPNSPEHRDKYEFNRRFLDSGIVTSNPEWAAVVAFYCAVHLIERLAAAEQPRPVHHRTHTHRRDWLVRHRRHRAVLPHYLALQDASEISRYGTANQFRVMFPTPAAVQALVDTQLATIESYVANFFSPPSPPTPPAATVGS